MLTMHILLNDTVMHIYHRSENDEMYEDLIFHERLYNDIADKTPDKKYHSCLYLHDSSVPAAGDIKQLQDTKKIYQCSCWKSFNIDISYKARLVIGLFVSIDPAADVHGE